MQLSKICRRNTGALVGAIVGLVLGSSSVYAVNITIGDGLGSGGTGVGREVGETEPNTVNSHVWDNEAFVIKGNKLILISGFDLRDGYGGFASGDIFVNTSGSTPVGQQFTGNNGYRTINGNGGYEFVLDLNIVGGTFNVVNIGANDGAGVTLQSGYYRQNDGGNPFAYLGGGLTGFADSQALVFREGLSTAMVQSLYGNDVSTSGENNYAIELDMSWWNAQFPNGNPFMSHFTLGCDNDVIHGQVSGGFDPVPDGGSTLMLLGLGMSGLALAGRGIARKS